ncbi:MAG: FMN-binding protein [Candidatus Nanopelagicales bacterium]
MTGFGKAIAPGVALSAAALGIVAGFDRALHPVDAPARGDASQASGTCADATTMTGDTVTTRWGPVQVRAQVRADGTICGSEAVVYPNGDGESMQINSYALPIIDQAVTTDGVAFDAVSGATYTSEGYRQSLQSILDQL